MILKIKKILFLLITSKLNSKKNLSYLDLNFRKIDFTNNDSLIFNHGNNGTIHRTGSKSPIPRIVESLARNQSDGSNYISFVSTSKRHIARKIRDEDLVMSELQEEDEDEDDEEYDEENWVESKTEDGYWYFWNSETDESVWAIDAWEKKVSKRDSIMWGTYRSLIDNAVKGVSEGHEKILEITGVGFRANLKGELLNLQLGFSHDINFKIPKNIKITVEKQTVIKVTGVDKELVAKVSSDIKSLKPVEPYKGKGIKERNQFFIRKEGKKK